MISDLRPPLSNSLTLSDEVCRESVKYIRLCVIKLVALSWFTLLLDLDHIAQTQLCHLLKNTGVSFAALFIYSQLQEEADGT
jgi:hypothetical protein